VAVEAWRASLYLPDQPAVGERLEIEVFRWARDIHSFIVRERIESPRACRGITVKG
jgi:hypothetical protein